MGTGQRSVLFSSSVLVAVHRTGVVLRHEPANGPRMVSMLARPSWGPVESGRNPESVTSVVFAASGGFQTQRVMVVELDLVNGDSIESLKKPAMT